MRQALYLCAGAGAGRHGHPAAARRVLLDWADVPAALRGEVLAYLGVLALALPPALLFRLYSTLNQSLGKPRW